MRKVTALGVGIDVLLIGAVIVGVVGFFVAGLAPPGWESDQVLFPESANWSKAILALVPISVLLGLLLAVLPFQHRDRIQDGSVTRHGVVAILVHWINTIGFALALASAVVILRWVSVPLPLDQVYFWHFLGAALIVVPVVAWATMQRTLAAESLLPRWSDVPAAIARVVSYTGLTGETGAFGIRFPDRLSRRVISAMASLGIREPAGQEKWLCVERAFSFTPLAILTFLVVATGLVKAAKYFFLVPAGVLQVSTFIHDWTTPFLLIVLAAHAAVVTVVPRYWPSLMSMFTGRVPVDFAEHHHSLWYKQLQSAATGMRRVPREVPPVARGPKAA